MPRIFSYKVVYDIGFAPNPFHGTCTLATCKPKVRAKAAVGDWVIGVGSHAQRTTGQIVYAMEVAERLTFDEYWTDPRFQRKKVDLHGSLKYRYGDNVYHRDAEGQWQQSVCRHSLPDGSPNPDHVAKDTRADCVLIASRFTYWGGEGPTIPATLRDWDGFDLAEPGRDYTGPAYPDAFVEAVITWIGTLEPGCNRSPADWPAG